MYLYSLQALSLILVFEIRGVLNIKICLEGGKWVNLTMHVPWCITGCPSNIFHQTTCKGQAWGEPKLCFAGISWRHVRQGSMEVTQGKTIKWKDQSCKQRSGREHLGGATSWSTRSQKNKGAWSALEKNRAKWSSRPPRPVGPGRPASPLFIPTGALLWQVSHSPSSLFVFMSS
jgi:hypothetical protein